VEGEVDMEFQPLFKRVLICYKNLLQEIAKGNGKLRSPNSSADLNLEYENPAASENYPIG
jgi:hypothetical protein